MKRNYLLMYNEKYVDYYGTETVEIGKIVDKDSNEDVMYIDYEKDLYERRGYHTCIDIYIINGREFPVAVVDDLHRPCLREHPEIFLSIMLHELGHYVNRDLERKDMTNTKLKDMRIEAILSGRVLDMELRADAFAAEHVGKNTFMRSMDYMIKMRRKRGDAGADLAIREFELRKKAVRNMK